MESNTANANVTGMHQVLEYKMMKCEPSTPIWYEKLERRHRHASNSLKFSTNVVVNRFRNVGEHMVKIQGVVHAVFAASDKLNYTDI